MYCLDCIILLYYIICLCPVLLHWHLPAPPQVEALEGVVSGLPQEVRSEISPALEEVRHAAERMARAHEAATTGRHTGANHE